MLTRQLEGAAGDARKVVPDDGILSKIGECHSSVLLTQPLPCDSHPEGVGDFVVKQRRREQHKVACKGILPERIRLRRRLLVT